AVEMSRLAATHAGSQEVKDLASEIESAQQPEIDTMNGWLKKWGADTMSHDMGHDSMPGMVSERDMDKLKKANGAAFDRLFLTAMIAHHRGAIDMARSEKGDGINPEATKLADAIIKTQTAEIARMRQMLG
ncbi:MAG TPA: DUF305 domain-containing protein, partial [Aeromicrobium sp.]|nr:DUF305 domain-containing protein [Aeromicrobium sp.]